MVRYEQIYSCDCCGETSSGGERVKGLYNQGEGREPYDVCWLCHETGAERAWRLKQADAELHRTMVHCTHALLKGLQAVLEAVQGGGA